MAARPTRATGDRGGAPGSLPHDFESLYRTTAPRVWRAVYAFTGGRREIAEDAVTEAFARAIERAATISHPSPWILQTAIRLALDEMKREGKSTTTMDAPFMRAQAADVGVSERVDLLRLLAVLSPNQRTAVVLRYTEDMPIADIAQMMGVASPTVRVHLMRARRQLKLHLDAPRPEER